MHFAMFPLYCFSWILHSFHSINTYNYLQDFLFLSMDYLEVCCLIFKHLGDFPIISLLLVFSLIALSSENASIWDLILLSLLETVL